MDRKIVKKLDTKKIKEKMPKHYLKYGEIHYDTHLHDCVYVCSACLKILDNFNNAYTTKDITALVLHVQFSHTNNDMPNEDSTKISKIVDVKENVNYNQNDDHNDNNDNVNSPMILSEDNYKSVAIYGNANNTNITTASPSKLKQSSFQTSPECVKTNDTMDGPYECNYCADKFTNVLELDRHQRKHILNYRVERKPQARPYQCNTCGKRTLTTESMTIHKQRFHSAESDSETIKCHMCQKLVLKVNLKQHLLIHTSLRLQCKYCCRSYKQKQTLRSHMKKQHPNILADMNYDIDYDYNSNCNSTLSNCNDNNERNQHGNCNGAKLGNDNNHEEINGIQPIHPLCPKVEPLRPEFVSAEKCAYMASLNLYYNKNRSC